MTKRDKNAPDWDSLIPDDTATTHSSYASAGEMGGATGDYGAAGTEGGVNSNDFGNAPSQGHHARTSSEILAELGELRKQLTNLLYAAKDSNQAQNFRRDLKSSLDSLEQSVTAAMRDPRISETAQKMKDRAVDAVGNVRERATETAQKVRNSQVTQDAERSAVQGLRDLNAYLSKLAAELQTEEAAVAAELPSIHETETASAAGSGAGSPVAENADTHTHEVLPTSETADTHTENLSSHESATPEL